jgi:threonine dehydrogenase-like Zn-dependent dehydrogenase
MRGLVFPGDRQVSIETFPDPVPAANEVVVRTCAAAVCGSDMHHYRMPAGERQRSGQAAIIPGHEPSGVVHAIGDGVTNVRVGDRVAVYHFRSCGYCQACRGGDMMWCPDRRGYGGPIHGSDAELLLTDARNCLPLPDEASFALGSMLMCVGGTAFQAMQKLQAKAGTTVAVFGLGPVGLAGLLFAQALGAEVVGIDRSRPRLQLAEALGAARVIDADNEDVAASVRRWAGPDGVNASFETSGAPAAQASSVAITGRAGRIAFVGFGSGGPSISPSEFIEKQLTLMGSFVFPIDAYETILGFVQTQQVPLESLVTHTVGLDDAGAAIQAFDRGETGKVIIAP